MNGIGKLLKNTLKNSSSNKLKLGELLSINNNDGVYFIILLASLLSMIPTPFPFPIISITFGVILTFLSVQLLIKDDLYIPNFISNISFKKKSISILMNKVIPYIRRLEIYINKNREYKSNINKKCIFLIKICILISSIIVAIPIPMLSFVPSIAIIVMCFGVINKNRLLINLGIILTIIAFLITVFLCIFLKYLFLYFNH